MRLRVMPYKAGSESAKVLAEALGGKRLRTEGRSRFVAREDDVIINWGNSGEFFYNGGRVMNTSELIPFVANKKLFFEEVGARVPNLIPKFWLSAEEIPDGDFPIVCRTVLNGHSGQGIVIANTREELVPAPLYVKYMKKKDEYRVHVGRVSGRKNPDTIIAVQRKARSKSVPDEQVNWHIRNHANGFIFARQNVQAPVEVLDTARQVFETTGLDFGACDVIYNEHNDKAYVLEINSAPGLAGSTVDDYARYFRKELGIPTEEEK